MISIIKEGNIKFESLIKFLPVTIGPPKKAIPNIPKKLNINISKSSLSIFLNELIFFDINKNNSGPKLKKGNMINCKNSLIL